VDRERLRDEINQLGLDARLLAFWAGMREKSVREFWGIEGS
jgi:hypothetical protein